MSPSSISSPYPLPAGGAWVMPAGSWAAPHLPSVSLFAPRLWHICSGFLETLWETSLNNGRWSDPLPPALAHAARRDCTGPSSALLESTADKGERSAGGQNGLGGGLLAISALPQVRASWGEGPSAPWGPDQFTLIQAASGSAKLLERPLSCS